MSAELLAGGPVAEAVLEDVRIRVEWLKEAGTTPGLGTILVGDDGASAGYVRKKHETCEAVGMASHNIHVDADAPPAALDDAVAQFNSDSGVHGYIIQHPVADGFDFSAALSAMDPAKDADGLHPMNLGKLVLQEDGPCRVRRQASAPCSCTTESRCPGSTSSSLAEGRPWVGHFRCCSPRRHPVPMQR
jgi:methylenetetrahydrofolate dehydrogenase (NADP+)/methenyltetrahydrofolate cyclohydrolase